jgi:hypothetical protein
MHIRAGLVTMLAVVVLTTTTFVTGHAHLGRSKSSFQKYFQALKTWEVSVNPVERFVFSLILANTNAPPVENSCKN